jgi:hypothetical protein
MLSEAKHLRLSFESSAWAVILPLREHAQTLVILSGVGREAINAVEGSALKIPSGQAPKSDEHERKFP